MKSSRFIALSVIALLVFGAGAMTNAAFAQNLDDDRWYLGEAAQADTYYIYEIEDYYVKNGAPFTMSLYFKEQDSNGVWTVPVYVVESSGKVITGTFRLGDNLAFQSAGSDVSAEMTPYVGAYQDTLTWLEAFTNKAQPESLNGVTWGKLACIGCGTLDPKGNEEVTAAGNTYQTTVLVNARGQNDSKIWVAKELPYPVKALTYADVNFGEAPVQYAFDLVEIGTGEPPVPSDTTVIPDSPITLSTGRGTYIITLSWSPNTIEPGKETEFTVQFENNKGTPIERVNYDLTIKNAATGEVIQELKNQNTGQSSSDTIAVNFEQGGPVTATVKINYTEGGNTGDIGVFLESADFNIVVVPEFPVAMVALTAALASIVLAVRLKGLPGKNWPA
ncbi:hypothetical protein [Candidatus Nitrososphaera sp. FF02]|uniref:hypothetical protein n=1 Tax=Candidatus Nitrososphaera sp. FF02 TaxID=3398226 RepID=UPI0039E74C74